jgi:quinol monooxygenase YgiN
MTTEYIRYVLKDHSPQSLISAYAEAGKHLAAAPECRAFELRQCNEDPNSFILRIHWESTAAHLEGFRKGPHFPPFFGAIRPFVSEIAEMRHYRDVGVEWVRASTASDGRA